MENRVSTLNLGMVRMEAGKMVFNSTVCKDSVFLCKDKETGAIKTLFVVDVSEDESEITVRFQGIEDHFTITAENYNRSFNTMLFLPTPIEAKIYNFKKESGLDEYARNIVKEACCIPEELEEDVERRLTALKETEMPEEKERILREVIEKIDNQYSIILTNIKELISGIKEELKNDQIYMSGVDMDEEEAMARAEEEKAIERLEELHKKGKEVVDTATNVGKDVLGKSFKALSKGLATLADALETPSSEEKKKETQVAKADVEDGQASEVSEDK